eukprot:2301634-Amphidinium_carterae.1
MGPRMTMRLGMRLHTAATGVHCNSFDLVLDQLLNFLMRMQSRANNLEKNVGPRQFATEHREKAARFTDRSENY